MHKEISTHELVNSVFSLTNTHLSVYGVTKGTPPPDKKELNSNKEYISVVLSLCVDYILSMVYKHPRYLYGII